MLLLPAPELPSFACVGMHMQANIDVLWQCLFWWSRPPCVLTAIRFPMFSGGG